MGKGRKLGDDDAEFHVFQQNIVARAKSNANQAHKTFVQQVT